MNRTKLGDFFIGFLGITAVEACIYLILRESTAWGLMAVIAGAVSLLAAFQAKRPFITLGIVATAVFPLIAFGACVVDVFRHGFD
ncbi:MAG TPA: hypothetical protein VGM51_14570 [Armatimonadota bacterium]